MQLLTNILFKNSTKKKHKAFVANLGLEAFYFSFVAFYVNFIWSVANNANYMIIKVESHLLVLFYATLKYNLTSTYSLTDMLSIQTGKNMIFSTYMSLRGDQRLALLTLLNSSKFNIMSGSFVFSNSIWLEREVQEFSNIKFLNLKDTRRLLLDYTILKATPQGEGAHANFNVIFFETIYT